MFDAELTEEERDRWLDRMAEEVVRRRMETPAVMALEMHRPLAFLGSQALIVATPFLGAFAGPENVLKFSRLVQDPANVERLIDRIEVLSARQKTSPDAEPSEHPS